MDSAQPPVLPPSPSIPPAPAPRRRGLVTLKLLFIAALVLLLQLPLGMINELRQERSKNREQANTRASVVDVTDRSYSPAQAAAEGYRIVERALKHSVLVLTLVFTAFFLFETMVGLRLHPMHYGLVGAALCLFYLALLALGEVLAPGLAYVGAAAASSALIVLYSVSILRSYGRASLIAGLLLVEHSVLYVVLHMESYALLAGTGALFAALAALMFFTRNVDWSAQDAGKAAT
jgi:inner membrane protein involved in colicin E2 resistance